MHPRYLSLLAAFAAAVPAHVYAHCQIPCGIYDDASRFATLEEHVTTLEKAMKQITELSAAEKPDYNQLVRWVNNKDQHADELSEIVTYYFMAQRVKPADPNDKAAFDKYTAQLTTLHGILVSAMKAKQTTDLAHVAQLHKLIDQFRALYTAK
ncbi:MAG: hypothetical protein AUJ96_01960 [Armatimonadetes bacterium CG2_30_66_41]|nr:MAG: hypothetical protein AUJ96_01960 [Armatimonadetes bacterium CG2_30_66_41]